MNTKDMREMFARFAANDEENHIQFIDNAHAGDWLCENIPRFECPDKTLEETYYFRWWTLRKHIKSTPEGFIFSEFLSDVPWAGAYNSINCALGFHIREARWLKNADEYVPDYLRFWFKGSGDVQAYSCWIGRAILDWCDTRGEYSLARELLSPLIEFYHKREETHLHESGLFWSHDDRDAMEYSISGDGLRPTLNSYMQANAAAVSFIANEAGESQLSREFAEKARSLKEKIIFLLWDERDGFFKVLPLGDPRARLATSDFAKIPPEHNAIEEIGFIPWCFDIPLPRCGCAFRYLRDSERFMAPYGPTTADMRHPRFMFLQDHECLWNGPNWPFATSQTLWAAENLLRDYPAGVYSKSDYTKLLKTYAACHYRKLPDGRSINWIDENIDPFTGEWLSRKILEQQGWLEEIGGRERGRDYNHSAFCSDVISGLCGIVPLSAKRVRVCPLADEATPFTLTDVVLCGRTLQVEKDENGTVRVTIDGHETASGIMPFDVTLSLDE